MQKKESGRIKAFKDRVSGLLERQGWEVENQPRGSIIDLVTSRYGAKRAFVVKPHGHISRAELAAIHKYGEINGIGVVYVHESNQYEILFDRMYKHLKRGW